MVTGFLLFGAALLVLYGMTASTEKVLDARQQYVVIDERMTDHRSRL